jgi:hypothetical protein
MNEHNEEEYIKKHGRPSPGVLNVLCDIRYFYRCSDDNLFFFLGASHQPGHIIIRRPLAVQETHIEWSEFADNFRKKCG